MGAELTGNWNSFLERFSPSQQDIYYREEYLKLYQSIDEQAVCFVYTDGNFCFLFPYLLRSFYFDGVCYHDFETAYGYGGPFSILIIKNSYRKLGRVFTVMDKKTTILQDLFVFILY
ncbi:hypothetical protein ACIXHQ_01550 [Bacteroides fragilis]